MGEGPMSDDTIWNRVINLEDTEGRKSLKGHPGITAHRFVSGPDGGTRWMLITLNVVESGGGIEPHYHEGLQADHAYFVLKGTATARIGDEEFEVRENGLMVFKSDIVHGFRMTSPDGGLILRLGASPDGRARGGSVFV